MNTPEPCTSCEFLYVNCMLKNDPNARGVECMKHKYMGNKKCDGYKKYVSVSEKREKEYVNNVRHF